MGCLTLRTDTLPAERALAAKDKALAPTAADARASVSGKLRRLESARPGHWPRTAPYPPAPIASSLAEPRARVVRR